MTDHRNALLMLRKSWRSHWEFLVLVFLKPSLTAKGDWIEISVFQQVEGTHIHCCSQTLRAASMQVIMQEDLPPSAAVKAGSKETKSLLDSYPLSVKSTAESPIILTDTGESQKKKD